jgi:hypothetical protein
MWDSVVLYLGLQAGGLAAGFLLGYYLGRKHKILGLMDNDAFVKKYKNY